MGTSALNAFGRQLVDLTLNKTRYDNWDLQWFVEDLLAKNQNGLFQRLQANS